MLFGAYFGGLIEYANESNLHTVKYFINNSYQLQDHPHFVDSRQENMLLGVYFGHFGGHCKYMQMHQILTIS